MSSPIVVVGSLNADLVAHVPRFPAPGETVTGSSFDLFPGGKGGNQACAAARLGARVHMIGSVGDDSNGRFLTDRLAESGVDITQVTVEATAPTGTAMITIDESGQNEIVVVPGANAHVTDDGVERCRDLIENAGCVLLQLEVPLGAVEAAARLAQRAGTTVILDPAPAQRAVLPTLSWVDFVTPNETELALLATGPDGVQELLSHGARNVVTKLGSSGAQLRGRAGQHSWSGFEVDAVDTTAAGDVWNGAFAAALLEGMPCDRAGRFANAAAALSVTRPGAQPSMPTRTEVEDFLTERSS